MDRPIGIISVQDGVESQSRKIRDSYLDVVNDRDPDVSYSTKMFMLTWRKRNKRASSSLIKRVACRMGFDKGFGETLEHLCSLNNFHVFLRKYVIRKNISKQPL
jgi:hypothetical protein